MRQRHRARFRRDATLGFQQRFRWLWPRPWHLGAQPGRQGVALDSLCSFQVPLRQISISNTAPQPGDRLLGAPQCCIGTDELDIDEGEFGTRAGEHRL